ncbi:carbamoyltransferase HypF [Thermodesulfobacterium sp. TA1]|uniref:carbamoyltransferase HypF n=1 Tax=Thermodesulfobacterium sp. TA1 TaxID=2234087 RepID=UPI0012329CE0|nr:carbamoyltransferase HypF [Thermodesulfobacterium sp. TA1]QER42632.1 carbamoyltransferase HypF [Thermodesulfobacterium sp. TA1]
MKIRYQIRINGVVQGVGFRPFIYNLAKSLGLAGFVSNDTNGVFIEVEGEETVLKEFLDKLVKEKPRLSQIYRIVCEKLEPIGYKEFFIKKSLKDSEITLDILPDVATCEFCLRELFDPKDHRYRYPFINCTLCGPRFTIIEALPYDREKTVMKEFVMCEDCYKEYTDPTDRRFHAQPIACPVCGPYLEFYDVNQNKIAEKEEALAKAIEAIKQKQIVAVKGLGGFHLICDATDEKVVELLRTRKRRSKKPLAVMFPDLSQLETYCILTPEEKELLLSPAQPIVLLEKKIDLLPEVIAPGLKKIGAFLPYTPLHHLILREINRPLVVTSANLSDEPIVISNEEAFVKLASLADYLLMHNRKILRRADDSVLKVIATGPVFIRRARGYAPLPVFLPFNVKKRVLAVGPREKNTFALAFQNKIVLSQHIGDIETLEDLKDFEKTLFDFIKLYEFEPEIVVADLHPHYETTKWAERFAKDNGLEFIKVQHHFAHILSCMAENEIFDEVLGIAWDGTGYGEDQTVWGGEFLLVKSNRFQRVGHFRHFRLIGGEKAVKEPKRIALALMLEIYGEEALNKDLPFLKEFSKETLKLLYQAWQKGLNSLLTSSCGRLFDGVAALTGLNFINHYEGESAMQLEDLFLPSLQDTYEIKIEKEDGAWIFDWEALVKGVAFEKAPLSVKATKFINTLAKVCEEIAIRVGVEKVCLSGGVMMNKPLVERIIERLTQKGFKVYLQRKVPPNDGGLSLGQALYPNL